MLNKSKYQHGFTIVELIVVVAVLSIVSGLLFGALHGLYTSNIGALARSVQDTETRGALRAIEKDLAYTNSFLDQLTVSSASLGNATGTTWSYKGSDNPVSADRRVLITTNYAVDKPSTDPSRMLVFTDTGAGCDAATATPAQNAVIYFVGRESADTTHYNLYRRTIVNITGGSICGQPTQKTSCHPQVTGTNPSVCKASDALLLKNVKSFTVDYYTNASDSSPIANVYGTGNYSTAIRNANSIRLTISASRLIDGDENVVTSTLRINRLY